MLPFEMSCHPMAVFLKEDLTNFPPWGRHRQTDRQPGRHSTSKRGLINTCTRESFAKCCQKPNKKHQKPLLLSKYLLISCLTIYLLLISNLTMLCYAMLCCYSHAVRLYLGTSYLLLLLYHLPKCSWLFEFVLCKTPELLVETDYCIASKKSESHRQSQEHLTDRLTQASRSSRDSLSPALSQSTTGHCLERIHSFDRPCC